MRHLLLAVMLGCSSTTSEESSVDASVDAASSDTSVADSTPIDTGVAVDTSTMADTTKAETTPADTTTPPGDTGSCKPFWCGCGSCVPQDIICTRSMAGCPLGCPEGPCPDRERVDVCTTVGDRCQRNGIAGDVACLSSADCPPGSCCSGTFTPPGKGKCGAC